MFKAFKINILILIFLLITPLTVYADTPATFNDLVENGKKYDGKTITIKGEAIGESLKRGENAWVNISDGTLPMGIWMKSEDADKIKTYGSYKYKGDIVEITGVFSRSCSQHGGDMDIHAKEVSIFKSGYTIQNVLEKIRVNIALILSLITLGIGFAYVKIFKVNKIQ